MSITALTTLILRGHRSYKYDELLKLYKQEKARPTYQVHPVKFIPFEDGKPTGQICRIKSD